MMMAMLPMTNLIFNVLKYQKFQPFNTRHELLNWQNQKVKKLLHKILPTSLFYAQYYQNLPLENWRNFPMIDKRIMMENFDHLNTVKIKKGEAFTVAIGAEKARDFSDKINRFSVRLSQGTTGQRSLMILSEEERRILIGNLLSKALLKPILMRQKVALFMKVNQRKFYETVSNVNLKLEFFDPQKNFPENLQELNEYTPTILVAPPSILRVLATAKLRGELKINPVKIISFAEVLEPLDHTYIEKVFSVEIEQVYLAIEGFLGITCSHGTLHLNEDLMVIQKHYLDQKSGRFLPIITDLNYRSQPLIRYCLDDILIERKKPCPCGSILTAVQQIEGRYHDIFYLPNSQNKKLIRIFPNQIRQIILTETPEIESYQVIQKNLHLIEIYLKGFQGQFSQRQERINNSFQKLFLSQGAIPPKILYYSDEYPGESDGKLRRIKREFSLNWERQVNLSYTMKTIDCQKPLEL